MSEQLLPELNIGLIGHVDHGKTSLTAALSGKWTDTHSEEIKRGITIKLGYADVIIRKCKKCKAYTSDEKCKCGGATEVQRMVSLVDAPGHETLMAIMITGAAIMDAAILLVAANETCPQPQTQEHLTALKVLGIKNVVVVQNKVDLVTKEDAKKNYNQIKSFVEKTLGFEVPIIPVSAVKNVNIDLLLEAIQELFETPKRDDKSDPQLIIARSFDINRPGADVEKLQGGVLGGAITQGIFSVGKEIEIRPGVKKNIKNQDVWVPVTTKIASIVVGSKLVKSKGPGGSVAIATSLDPAMTKGDSLVGDIVGYVGKLPEVLERLSFKVTLFDKVLGIKEDQKIDPLKIGEPLMVSVGTATTVGITQEAGKVVRLRLKRPVCANKGEKIAISRRFGNHWHLIGYGEII